MTKQNGYSYKFDESKCSSCEGNCCIGSSGYIWMSSNEIENLANHLGVSVQECFDKYLIKYDYRFSIKEKQVSDDNFACIFFDLNKKQCSIYEVRPKQCRTFPFWSYFKNNVQEVIDECPAIVK